jgi:DNA-binding winged helix-turn-helix (wHTH) protein
MKFTFGDCVLDLAARQLWRAGSAVSLEPKMYELLETLIQRRPAVVKNEELDEILWPKVYVARTSLSRLVSELRSVLGDTPRDSRIIRTVYKTGYAFCASVGALLVSSQPSGMIGLVRNGRCIPLTDGVHIAGRGTGCSVVIDATTVSRHHARITVLSGSATIEDLNSTNGTHVNGTKITAATRLATGNKIALGNEVLTVQIDDPSAPTIKVDPDRDAARDARL